MGVEEGPGRGALWNLGAPIGPQKPMGRRAILVSDWLISLARQ